VQQKHRACDLVNKEEHGSVCGEYDDNKMEKRNADGTVDDSLGAVT